MRRASIVLLTSILGCGSSSSSEPGPDAETGFDAVTETETATDTITDTEAEAGAARDVVCDPLSTFEVLRAGSAGDAKYQNLGDVDPATPDEVGDGKWHLFAGVNDQSATPQPYALVHEAIADKPEGPYTLTDAPLNDAKDAYDLYGKETPSYFRADPHTEYVYYCGVSTPYAPRFPGDFPHGRVAALKRVDGGAWTKLGPVLDFESTSEATHCEPDVARDPSTGQLVMLYHFIDTNSAGTISDYGLAARTSTDPEHFSAATAKRLTHSDPSFPARPTLSLDPYAHVWRISWDVGYPKPTITNQSWSETPVPDVPTLLSHAAVLHDGAHDLHPDIHVNWKTAPSTDQGSVLQPSSAIYPDADTILFFYTGVGTAYQLRVEGQKCTRK